MKSLFRFMLMSTRDIFGELDNVLLGAPAPVQRFASAETLSTAVAATSRALEEVASSHTLDDKAIQDLNRSAELLRDLISTLSLQGQGAEGASSFDRHDIMFGGALLVLTTQFAKRMCA